MIIENIVGTVNSGIDMGTTVHKNLFDLLASGDYKNFLVPDYFPEVEYIKEDDVLFMKSSLYARHDLSPTFYWFLAFDEKGNYMSEATPGYISLTRDSNLLHISAVKSRSNDEYRGLITTYQGIMTIGVYSMKSDRYSISTDNSMIKSQAEYDDDGGLIIDNNGSISKALYVPSNDTVAPVIKSCMYKIIDDLNAGKIKLPEP